jgi:uncharacterized Zn finger protein (UPF0148 family)
MTFVSKTSQVVELVGVTCSECGVTFGLPEGLYRMRRHDHGTWYCPNGHTRCFVSESEAEKYRRLFAAERTRVQAALDQAEAAERTAAAHKGHATRLRKRAAAGVCAFCNRNFENVARHVATKHPEHVPNTPQRTDT